MKKQYLVLPIAVALAFTAEAHAHGYKLGSIVIDHPWARPTAQGTSTGAAYLTLENSGGDKDALVAAASPIAARTEIHETIRDGDVMKMRPVETGVSLAPGSKVEFKPGGYHIMLFQLKEKLEEGQHIPMTLTFAKAGSIPVDVFVQKPGAAQGADMTMEHSAGAAGQPMH